MSKRFADEITLAAATATNLLAAMVLKGYTGSPMASELTYTPNDDIREGASNSVSATVGASLTGGQSKTERGHMVDLAQIWLYSTPGTTVEVFAQGF